MCQLFGSRSLSACSALSMKLKLRGQLLKLLSEKETLVDHRNRKQAENFRLLGGGFQLWMSLRQRLSISLSEFSVCSPFVSPSARSEQCTSFSSIKSTTGAIQLPSKWSSSQIIANLLKQSLNSWQENSVLVPLNPLGSVWNYF